MAIHKVEQIMNWKSIFTALAVALLAMASSVPAFAHGGYYRGGYYGHPRVSVGVGFGWPGYWGYPGYNYAPPAYYYPPVTVAPASPPVYIERGDARSGPVEPRDYWYFCPESNTYYPYVKQCAGGWQRVSPQPPS